MKCVKKYEGGFTLIELMVSALVFLMAVMSLLALLLGTVQGNASAQASSGAAALANGFAEEFKQRQGGWNGILSLAVEAPALAVAQNQWTMPSLGPWADGVPHDLEGRARGSAGARKAIYCIHYRTAWQPLGTLAGNSDEVLVTVRVAFPVDGSESFADCQPASIEAQLATGGNGSAVLVPILVRRIPR